MRSRRLIGCVALLAFSATTFGVFSLPLAIPSDADAAQIAAAGTGGCCGVKIPGRLTGKCCCSPASRSAGSCCCARSREAHEDQSDAKESPRRPATPLWERCPCEGDDGSVIVVNAQPKVAAPGGLLIAASRIERFEALHFSLNGGRAIEPPTPPPRAACASV